MINIRKNQCVGCGACAKICAHNGPQIADKKCHIDHDACAGCGRCIAICPKDAITVEKNLARIDYTKCDNCGLCATVCPKKLIKDSNVENLGEPKPVVQQA